MVQEGWRWAPEPQAALLDISSADTSQDVSGPLLRFNFFSLVCLEAAIGLRRDYKVSQKHKTRRLGDNRPPGKDWAPGSTQRDDLTRCRP